ncbi:MAG: hypothetical protein GY729_02535 [Desulfobacteraceae bacterium]|nr:hypothetical protein [Desulfobacteraceae bacterium]
MTTDIIVKLKKVVENPYLNMLVGIVLLYSSISEAIGDYTKVESFELQAHHGIILFAFIHILRTLPDFFISLEYMHKGNQSQDLD